MTRNACPCAHPFRESGCKVSYIKRLLVRVYYAGDPDVRTLSPENVSVITNTT